MLNSAQTLLLLVLLSKVVLHSSTFQFIFQQCTKPNSPVSYLHFSTWNSSQSSGSATVLTNTFALLYRPPAGTSPMTFLDEVIFLNTNISYHRLASLSPHLQIDPFRDEPLDVVRCQITYQLPKEASTNLQSLCLTPTYPYSPLEQRHLFTRLVHFVPQVSADPATTCFAIVDRVNYGCLGLSPKSSTVYPGNSPVTLLEMVTFKPEECLYFQKVAVGPTLPPDGAAYSLKRMQLQGCGVDKEIVELKKGYDRFVYPAVLRKRESSTPFVVTFRTEAASGEGQYQFSQEVDAEENFIYYTYTYWVGGVTRAENKTIETLWFRMDFACSDVMKEASLTGFCACVRPLSNATQCMHSKVHTNDQFWLAPASDGHCTPFQIIRSPPIGR